MPNLDQWDARWSNKGIIKHGSILYERDSKIHQLFFYSPIVPYIEMMMYSALVEPAVEGGEPCIRILLIAYAVYGLSRYCIRTTSDLAHPLLDFTSDYLGEFGQLYLAR